MSYKDILSWSERGLTVDSLYPYDDWSPLQFSASVGDLAATKVLLSEGADVNYQSATKAIPHELQCFLCPGGSCLLLDPVLLPCCGSNVSRKCLVRVLAEDDILW